MQEVAFGVGATQGIFFKEVSVCEREGGLWEEEQTCQVPPP